MDRCPVDGDFGWGWGLFLSWNLISGGPDEQTVLSLHDWAMAIRSQVRLPVRWALRHELLPLSSSGPSFRLLNSPRAEAFKWLAACRTVPQACQLELARVGVRLSHQDPRGHPHLLLHQSSCFVQASEGPFNWKKGSAVKTTFENQCPKGSMFLSSKVAFLSLPW